MYSLIFGLYALAQAALFVWLLREYRVTGAAAAAVLLLPQFGLIYDNAIVALGRQIGFGGLLESLSWPRFWLHWFCGAWLIVASGSILRMADIPWAKSRVVMGAFCVVTALCMAWDLPYFWSKSLMPVCEYDLIRYSVQVGKDGLCSPDQPIVPSTGALPQIITCLIVIGAGAVLAVQRRFPWMLIGGVLMFISASPKFSRHKLDNLGEVLIVLGAIWAIAHFARARQGAAASKSVAT